jgi:hypothetical protein
VPGFRMVTKPHHLWVYPKSGEPYRLPRGGHGDGARAEIERGHIRRMARQFGVIDCMAGALPGL